MRNKGSTFLLRNKGNFDRTTCSAAERLCFARRPSGGSSTKSEILKQNEPQNHTKNDNGFNHIYDISVLFNHFARACAGNDAVFIDHLATLASIVVIVLFKD